MARYKSAPEITIDPKKSYNAVIETTAGSIKVELFADEAPNTVNNFVFLAREKYYNNVIFHRVISGLHDPGRRPDGHGHAAARATASRMNR